MEQAIRSLGFANAGQDTFTSKIVPMQTSANMITSTFKVQSGNMLVVSDASGNLSGDGSGNLNAATGEFTVVFNSSPAAEIIATVDLAFDAGSEIIAGSNTNGLPFKYTLPNAMGMGDSIVIQDPVSSMFVVGFSGSIWMTRGALDFMVTPEWWKLASITGAVQSLEVSADGDYIWAGTSSGRLYRISGLQGARSYTTADLDSGATAVSVDLVDNYFGRNITSIAVDPNDNDRVLVTLGNYNNSNYVYYSSNATDVSPTFVVKDGNLGNFPVYAATFDKGNSNYAIIGTEFGIFSTQNINTTQPQWGADNSGLARVPVFTLKQYRTNKSSTNDMDVLEGDIFAGTYGRGTFQTTTLQTTRPLDISERDMEGPVDQLIKLFPNPADDKTTMEIKLAAGDHTIQVLDLNGRVVTSMPYTAVSNGVQRIEVNVSTLGNGLYIVGVPSVPASFSRLMIVH